MSWQRGFDDGSRPECIVHKREDGGQRVVAKVRWGCGCCEGWGDLSEAEQHAAKLIAQAPAMKGALLVMLAELKPFMGEDKGTTLLHVERALSNLLALGAHVQEILEETQ